MSISKQKIAFLTTCLCAGSAFSAGFSMPHAPRAKACPIYMDLEKVDKTVVAKPGADKGQAGAVDRKANNGQVINTQTSATGGGGGAGKTTAPTLPAQKSAPNGQ